MSKPVDPTTVPGTKPLKTGPRQSKVRTNPPTKTVEARRLVKGRGWVA